MIETKTLRTLKNIKIIFRVVLLTKLCVLMIDLANQLLFIEERNTVNRFIEAILEEYEYCKKVIEKNFNKNLVKSVEEEEKFQLNNKCWICYRLFTEEDKKVRYHDYITGNIDVI